MDFKLLCFSGAAMCLSSAALRKLRIQLSMCLTFDVYSTEAVERLVYNTLYIECAHRIVDDNMSIMCSINDTTHIIPCRTWYMRACVLAIVQLHVRMCECCSCTVHKFSWI